MAQDIVPLDPVSNAKRITEFNALQVVEEKNRRALPTFEELKAATRQPAEHMCVACMAKYDKMNAAKRKADPKWQDVYPVCKLTQEPGRKTGSYAEPDVTLEEWAEAREESLDEAKYSYETMLISTNPVLWAAAVLGIVTEGYDYDTDGDLVNMDRWHQRWMISCSSRYKSYRAGRRSGKTFSMILEILFFMWTNPNKRVLFIAPYEKQVIAFIDEVDKLVENSPLKYEHRSKSHHTFKFPNGSSLESIMTGGDKAGGGAKARGQKADMLVFDEACYIGQQDIEAALAILVDNPKCRVLASSTPTGRRDWFYKVSTKFEESYKEFHFPSHVSPAITKIADSQLRTGMSTAAYRQEILAEFGEEGAGVFSNADLDAALQPYSLKDRRQQGPLPGCAYVVGVDWNGRKIGNHIVVCEYNRSNSHYKLVDKVVVKDDAYSVDTTIKVILDIWRYWGAAYIYYDAGYGETYEAVLNAEGKKNPKLGAALEAIPMQGYQEVYNPVTQEKEKKPNKNFAINLLANRLEAGRIILPYEEDVIGEDESEYGLVQQMRKLTVESVSVTGRPVYSDTPDHTMVGFYLAILAFHMKMSSLGQAPIDTYFSVRAKTPGKPAELDLTGGLANPHSMTARDLEKMNKKAATKHLKDTEDNPTGVGDGGFSRLKNNQFTSSVAKSKATHSDIDIVNGVPFLKKKPGYGRTGIGGSFSSKGGFGRKSF